MRLLLVLFALLVASPVAADQKETERALRDHARWLAIQTAQDASHDGRRLTLHKTDGNVVLFADRPYRTAESMLNSRFIDSWDKAGEHSFGGKQVSLFIDEFCLSCL